MTVRNVQINDLPGYELLLRWKQQTVKLYPRWKQQTVEIYPWEDDELLRLIEEISISAALEMSQAKGSSSLGKQAQMCTNKLPATRKGRHHEISPSSKIRWTRDVIFMRRPLQSNGRMRKGGKMRKREAGNEIEVGVGK